MIRIVDYESVLQTTRAEGFRSLYHNSGAFGFFPGDVMTSLGWIGPDDPTIRPEAIPLVGRVPAPYEANLAAAVASAWSRILCSKLWVMPKSHWSYELRFGSATWLPDQLKKLGIDAGDLIGRTNAAAIEGDVEDAKPLTEFMQSLLTNLNGSDFALLFPGRKTVATLHHHKQVWWTTTDRSVADGLNQIVSRP